MWAHAPSSSVTCTSTRASRLAMGAADGSGFSHACGRRSAVVEKAPPARMKGLYHLLYDRKVSFWLRARCVLPESIDLDEKNSSTAAENARVSTADGRHRMTYSCDIEMRWHRDVAHALCSRVRRGLCSLPWPTGRAASSNRNLLLGKRCLHAFGRHRKLSYTATGSMSESIGQCG